MLDSRSSWSASNHDDVWELIPWYVNGSLPPEDLATINRHVISCPECAVEVARQRGIAGSISIDEPYTSSAAGSWKKLSSQIKSERSLPAHRWAILNRFAPSPRGMMFGGACAAACMIAVFTYMPGVGEFRTLTRPGSPSTMIKFQTVSEMAPERLEALMMEHGLELVDGPSASGVYTAAPRNAAADPQAFSEALMKSPQIMFAAPAE